LPLSSVAERNPVSVNVSGTNTNIPQASSSSQNIQGTEIPPVMDISHMITRDGVERG
jgi:hypothetical protein